MYNPYRDRYTFLRYKCGVITTVNLLWSSFADDPPRYLSSLLNTVLHYTGRPTHSNPSWWHQKYNTWGTGNDMGMLKFSKSYALVVSFLFPLLLFLWINPDCATREYTRTHAHIFASVTPTTIIIAFAVH